MKLRGFIFEPDGTVDKIEENLINENYVEMWALLQIMFPESYDGPGGYLVVKEDD